MNRHERRKQKVLIASPNPAQVQAGNYYPLLIEGAKQIKAGEVFQTFIRHDNWCALLKIKDGVCNCSPDVEFIKVEKS